MKLLEISFMGGTRIYVILLLVTLAFYFGWIKLSPVPVIFCVSGINTLLTLRFKKKSLWLGYFCKTLFVFFLAETFCFIGLYLFWEAFFILVHDLLHILSLYYFISGVLFLFSGKDKFQDCLFTCCKGWKGWKKGYCILREAIVAILIGGVISSIIPIGLWLLDRQHPFLGLPEGVTELIRGINLLFFPGITLFLFGLLIILIEFQRQILNQQIFQAFLLGAALLFYSLFQLLIALIIPGLAIPVEEFLEFLPMVPVFYFLIGKIQNVEFNVITDKAVKLEER